MSVQRQTDLFKLWTKNVKVEHTCSKIEPNPNFYILPGFWRSQKSIPVSDWYDKNFEQQKSMRRHCQTTFYLEPANRSQKILFAGTLKRYLTPTTRWVSCCSRSDVHTPKQAYGRPKLDLALLRRMWPKQSVRRA